MGYRLHCYNCGYEEDEADGKFLCPRCNNIRIVFIKTLDGPERKLLGWGKVEEG